MKAYVLTALILVVFMAISATDMQVSDSIATSTDYNRTVVDSLQASASGPTRANVRMGGTFRYLNEQTNQYEVCRNNVVQLWDADSSSSDDLLWEGSTDVNGYFMSSYFENAEGFLQGTQDLYVKCFAQNAYCNVQYLSTDLSPIYGQTSIIQDIADGTHTYTWTLSSGSNGMGGAFYIANQIDTAHNAWAVLSGSYMSDFTHVLWSNTYTGAFYSPSTQTMTISRLTDSSTYSPNTFDDDIIFHEYGHVIENYYGFFDAGLGYSQSWMSISSESLAASEGFAYFFSSYVRSSPLQVNWNSTFSYNIGSNLENGNSITNNVENSSVCANSLGESSEGAVAGILWDIYDNNNDDRNGDGIGDTLPRHTSDLMNVLMTRYVNGHLPDTAAQLYTAWLQTPSKGHDQEMWALWYEHGTNKDITPPVIPNVVSSSIPLSTYCSVDNVTVTVNSSDLLSGVKGYVASWNQLAIADPGTVLTSTTNSIVSSLLSSGSWYLHIRAIDAAGNVSQILNYGPFLIDNQAPSMPQITYCNQPINTWTTNNSIVISWSATDDSRNLNNSQNNQSNSDSSNNSRLVSGYTWEWSNVPTQIPDNIIDGTVTTNISPVLTEGSWYFHVKAQDNFGHWSDTSHYGPITIDLTNPIASSLINNGANSTSSHIVSIVLTASDVLSGIDKMSFSNDNVTWSDWENYNSSITWDLLLFGGTNVSETKIVYVKIKDIAGNVVQITESIYYNIILISPRNLTITRHQNGLLLQWSPVNNATSYHVYSSTNGLGSLQTWQLLASSIGTNTWVDNNTSEICKFYKVVASSAPPMP